MAKNVVPFIGGSYTLRNKSVNSQETVNLYPSINELEDGKTKIYLSSTPGLKQLFEINDTNENDEVRGLRVTGQDRCFIVVGNKFIELTYLEQEKIYQQRIIGALNTSSGKVSMDENGLQLGIVDGDNYYLYTYETKNSLDKFEVIEVDGWLGSDTITYFSSYFVFIERDSRKFYISEPLNGSVLQPLDFAIKEGGSDNIVNAISINSQLWLLGTKTTEVYFNSGDNLFPISKVSNGVIEYGCLAKHSVSIADNSLIWLGRDPNGSGTIYRVSGSYQPERISNFAIEYFIQSQDRIDNATSYCYQEDGHYFYVLNFPSSGTTWVYDLITNMWHERQFFNTKTGQSERHIAENHIYWKNKHFVGDYRNNKIYEMNLKYYDDNGELIRRVRRSPHLVDTSGLNNIRFFDFQLDLDVGSEYIAKDYTEIPKIFLRYSNDGGNTWSNYIPNDLWSIGDYKKRIIWRSLGSARDRVFEISTSAPLRITLLNAYSNMG